MDGSVSPFPKMHLGKLHLPLLFDAQRQITRNCIKETSSFGFVKAASYIYPSI